MGARLLAHAAWAPVELAAGMEPDQRLAPDTAKV